MGGGVAFCGPFVGEFGHELMTWQGFCRRKAKEFDKVYISSFPDMEPLYKDFADVFIPHNHPGRALDWTDLSKVSYDMPEDVDVHIKPHKRYRVPDQDFIKFGVDDPIDTFPFLIHARHLERGSNKNYPERLWEEIVAGLSGRVASVGTQSDLHISGTTDLRDIPLDKLMRYMVKCTCIGGSSGVMHLAALCGASVVVWADGRTYFGETLEKRYKETWNPFGVHVEYICHDEWRPAPSEILSRIGRIAMGQDVLSEREEPRKVVVDVDDETMDALAQAMESGRWFLTISWFDGKNAVRHRYQRRDFPIEDLASTLEHLRKKVREERGQLVLASKQVSKESIPIEKPVVGEVNATATVGPKALETKQETEELGDWE